MNSTRPLRNARRLWWAALAAALPIHCAQAAVTAAEAEKLKSELTPIGAEKAGNKDGSIPAWSGGYKGTVPPAAGVPGDPFAAEKPLYSVTADNAPTHADQLTPGVMAMLKKFPTTYRLDVYPTHRTVAMPAWFNDATYTDATQTKLVQEPGARPRVEGDAGGVPFPIPKDGAEAMTNAIVPFITPAVLTLDNYLIQSDGRRVLTSNTTTWIQRYFTADERLKQGIYYAVRFTTNNPTLRSGEGGASQYYLDSNKDSAWVYVPGQRRIRKLPAACCDTPTPFSAGLISFDEIGVYFGSIHKYDWKLLGKKEMLIPYNGNRLLTPKKSEAIFSQSHLNPDHVRWELHRVWVVEGTVKSNERHLWPRSVYYLDEDTWSPALGERFDAQGKLGRFGFQIPVVMPAPASYYPTTFGWHDLSSGAAYIGNVYNEPTSRLKIVDAMPAATLSPEAMAAENAR